jgi:hypothetical protein
VVRSALSSVTWKNGRTFSSSCDVLGGEAVLFGDFEGETRTAIEINLHSGANTTPPWPGLQAVAISGNGQYVAYVNGEVRDAKTGAIMARLRGQPEAISWLGHVVVQLVGTDGIEAIDWQTGRVIWQRSGAAKCPCQGLSVFTSSMPFSEDMALNVQGGIATQQGLWLVSLAHGPLRLAARVEAGII